MVMVCVATNYSHQAPSLAMAKNTRNIISVHSQLNCARTSDFLLSKEKQMGDFDDALMEFNESVRLDERIVDRGKRCSILIPDSSAQPTCEKMVSHMRLLFLFVYFLLLDLV